jgi:hypothetical protein
MPEPLILAVGGDPGPAAALEPVLIELVNQGWSRLEALTYRQAGKLWGGKGLDCTALDENLDVDTARRLLQENAAALLLTSTSFNEVMLEAVFLKAAQELGMPSLCVLDFPSYYQARFTDADGRRVSLPTLIAVGDEMTRTEMIAEDFPADGLVVTGMPAFDRLARFKLAFSHERRTRVRRKLGVGPLDKLVLFVSQPLRDFYRIRPGQLGELGFDEIQVLTLLVEALDTLVAESHPSLRLIIRPHPRENRALLESIHAKHFHLAVDDSTTSEEAICAADLVVGMNSVMLMEACYLSAITMSVQPGLAQTEFLPTNRTGVSNPVYDQTRILPTLRHLLLDDRARTGALARLEGLATDGRAAERVAALAGGLLGRS